MAFIKGLFKKFTNADIKNKKNYSYISQCNPMQFWNIEGEIGDGAFGKVYKVKRTADNVIAALKQVKLEEEGDLDEYMVEIEILTELKHNNIINLHEAYHFENKLWMALEFCNGGAIDSLMLDLDKNLNEAAIKYVAKEVLCGLVFLHSHGVIHRDMKAGNVLVTKNSDVKLADFGVSAKFSTDQQKRNTVQGTPYWMAPEVIACQNTESYYDCRVDIWSFGITLIELAQMRPPNHQMQPSRVLVKIAKADPPTLDQPGRWSVEFNSFLKTCLVKNPEQRPYGAELLKDPFVDSVNESHKKALKVLIYEAKAEQIEEIEEEVDLKDVNHSNLLTSDNLDDISKFSEDNDDISSGSSDTLSKTPNETSSDRSSLDNVLFGNSDTEVSKAKTNTLVGVDDEKMNTEEKQDGTINNQKKSYFKTMTKTRKFIVDGEEITTTTKKLVREGLETKSQDQIQERKMEIREFKILAKEESRQKRQLLIKLKFDEDILSSKQKSEEQNFDRNFESEMDALVKSQNSRLEKLENLNFNEVKALQKKLLADKLKLENDFKIKYKEDLNKDSTKGSKSQRKDNSKKIKEENDIVFQEKFKPFKDILNKDIEEKLARLTHENRKKMEDLEITFLKERYAKGQKYRKERSQMVIEQCRARFQLETQNNEELFMLRRQQVKYHNEKEIEYLEKSNKKELDYLESIQQSERKTFPRFIKNESKRRMIQKKTELQTQVKKGQLSASEMKARLKQFLDSEKIREGKDLKRREEKLSMFRQTMLEEHMQKYREYEQIHAEQKKELTDQNNEFMKEAEANHRDEIAQMIKAAEEEEIAKETDFKSEENKLKKFHNVSQDCNGCITSYSTRVSVGENDVLI